MENLNKCVTCGLVPDTEKTLVVKMILSFFYIVVSAFAIIGVAALTNSHAEKPFKPTLTTDNKLSYKTSTRVSKLLNDSDVKIIKIFNIEPRTKLPDDNGMYIEEWSGVTYFTQPGINENNSKCAKQEVKTAKVYIEVYKCKPQTKT